MKLRRKLVIFTVAAVLCAIAVLYSTLHTVLEAQFVKIETEEMRQDANRALAALADEIVALDTIVEDWAAWDDTYAFVADVNQSYIDSNFVDSTFTNLQVNFVLLVNTNGAIVYSKGFSLEQEIAQPLPQSLAAHLAVGSPLWPRAISEAGLAGILMLPEGPTLISAQPILTSTGGGPARGIFVMGRFLNADRVQRLAVLTRLKLTVHDYAEAGDLTASLDTTGIVVRPLNVKTVAGYALVRDVYGQPALVLRVHKPRTLSAQEQMTVHVVLLSIFILASAFSLLTLAYIDKTVLTRLAYLTRQMQQIAQTGDLTTEVRLSGNDELTKLAERTAEMLASLRGSRQKLEENERALSELNAQLWTALQAKDQMIHNVSHELRTPLTLIRGYIELMRDGAFGPPTNEQARALAILDNQGDRLQFMINRLLMLQTFNPQHMRPIEIAPAELIQEVYHAWQPHALGAGVAIRLDLDDHLPRLLADADHLRQVLINLLDNAIKFSPMGSTVSVHAWSSNSQLVIAVADRGVGIPLEKLKHIGERFYQVDGSSTRRFGGMGIGLALSKAIARAHDGNLYVHSHGEGTGCAVYLVLPTIIASTPVTASIPQAAHVPSVALCPSGFSQAHQNWVQVQSSSFQRTSAGKNSR